MEIRSGMDGEHWNHLVETATLQLGDTRDDDDDDDDRLCNVM